MWRLLPCRDRNPLQTDHLQVMPGLGEQIIKGSNKGCKEKPFILRDKLVTCSCGNESWLAGASDLIGLEKSATREGGGVLEVVSCGLQKDYEGFSSLPQPQRPAVISDSTSEGKFRAAGQNGTVWLCSGLGRRFTTIPYLRNQTCKSEPLGQVGSWPTIRRLFRGQFAQSVSPNQAPFHQSPIGLLLSDSR